MEIERIIQEYQAGPGLVRAAVAGMTGEQLDARPVPGKWSTREVVCHLADLELVYGDRMKRVIAEREPTMFGADPDVFARHLAYAVRDVEVESAVIDATRKQMARILQSLAPADFQRKGIHSEDGPLSLTTLLERITGHIPHHLKFVEEKKAAMR